MLAVPGLSRGSCQASGWQPARHAIRSAVGRPGKVLSARELGLPATAPIACGLPVSLGEPGREGKPVKCTTRDNSTYRA